MRFVLTAFCLILVSAIAFAQQNTSGIIFGLVSDRDARLIEGAPIDVKNVDTGATLHVDSGTTGHYRIVGLPLGDYEVSIRINVVNAFVQQRVKVSDATPVRLDIIVPVGRQK
jgi:Carboxypeptidase regulatory-like domain